jgi:hypothetical protein
MIRISPKFCHALASANYGRPLERLARGIFICTRGKPVDSRIGVWGWSFVARMSRRKGRGCYTVVDSYYCNPPNAGVSYLQSNLSESQHPKRPGALGLFLLGPISQNQARPERRCCVSKIPHWGPHACGFAPEKLDQGVYSIEEESGAGDGNRTHVRSLGSFYTAIVRRPLGSKAFQIIHNDEMNGTDCRLGEFSRIMGEARGEFADPKAGLVSYRSKKSK